MQFSSADASLVADANVEALPLSASIVIPTFNRRQLLMKTLTSLAEQTVPADRYEVIVGIDGSTDDTVEALANSHLPYRLRWVWQENQGTAAAVNQAATRARHDVLIFLGDDQLAFPELVATHLDAQARFGDVVIQGFYPNAPASSRSGASMAYEASLRRLPEVFASGGPRRWHLWGANFSLRRSTWERLGGYDPSFRRCEDTDLGIRLAQLGVPSIFEPEARTAHLHSVTYEGFRGQSFSEGRAIVRLCQKHGLPLAAFSGATFKTPLDRFLKRAWQHAPDGADLLGRFLLFGLQVADQVQSRPGQLALARLVRRIYKMGGMMTQPGRWDLGGNR